MDDVLEIFMLNRLTAKHQHKGFMAVRIDIGCGMAKPMHIILCATL